MALSEKDVDAMEIEVMRTATNEAEEREWRADQIAALERTEQRVMAGWRLAQALRDDEVMQSTIEDLRKIRAGLEYLRG